MLRNKRRREYLVDREIIQAVGLGCRDETHILNKVMSTARRFTLTNWGARRLAKRRVNHLCIADALQRNSRLQQYKVNAFNSFGAEVLGIPVLKPTPEALSELKDWSCGMSTMMAIALTFPSAYGNRSVQ